MMLAVVLVTIVGPAAAKVYSQCQLATLLRNNGITSNINDWVCLIISESSGNTTAKGGPNSNGSYDYGLFQVNSRYWCGTSGPGGDCNVACSKLLDENVADDIACAKKIYARHGFSAWYGWKNKCKNPPAVTPC
uniref:lysozyme n=1 Tax=Coptotermes formosanus TaxID=36987 RepID=L0AT95_COPFO|nr:C-type lysozyme-2 [Coptotermes formosanus]